MVPKMYPTGQPSVTFISYSHNRWYFKFMRPSRVNEGVTERIQNYMNRMFLQCHFLPPPLVDDKLAGVVLSTNALVNLPTATTFSSTNTTQDSLTLTNLITAEQFEANHFIRLRAGSNYRIPTVHRSTGAPLRIESTDSNQRATITFNGQGTASSWIRLSGHGTNPSIYYFRSINFIMPSDTMPMQFFRFEVSNAIRVVFEKCTFNLNGASTLESITDFYSFNTQLVFHQCTFTFRHAVSHPKVFFECAHSGIQLRLCTVNLINTRQNVSL